MVKRDERDETRREYASLRAKQAALESGKTEGELADSQRYAELVDRIEEMGDELGKADAELVDETEFLSSLREVEEDNG
nr:HalX domain-containing protein [Halorutilus salinus]